MVKFFKHITSDTLYVSLKTAQICGYGKTMHILNYLDLKGQCHEIFDNFFFGLKDSTYEQAKTVSQTFAFSRRYSIAKMEIRVSA